MSAALATSSNTRDLAPNQAPLLRASSKVSPVAAEHTPVTIACNLMSLVPI